MDSYLDKKAKRRDDKRNTNKKWTKEKRKMGKIE